MTDRATRLYVLVVGVLVFVVTWALVAARPWASAKADPRLAALAQRERMLRVDARLVRQIVAARATVGRPPRQGGSTTSTTQAAPVVRVVNLPPLTITRSS
jgi:hypothetical protein